MGQFDVLNLVSIGGMVFIRDSIHSVTNWRAHRLSCVRCKYGFRRYCDMYHASSVENPGDERALPVANVV